MASLYPNKQNPTAYRVKRTRLNIQKYFNVSSYGSLEAAYDAASEYESYLDKIDRLKKEIEINRLFNSDGTVKALGFGITHRNKCGAALPYVYINLNTGNHPTLEKQISNRLLIRNKSFYQVYNHLQKWISKHTGIELTYGIKREFNEAFSYLNIQANEIKNIAVQWNEKHGIDESRLK